VRVFVTHARRTRHERGAVAVIVGILAIVLFGIAAFTVDFGMAYVSKRQLQTASDAGALAAASIYAQRTGDCEALSADGAAKTLAQTAADDIREENRPGSTGGTLDVGCGDNGALDVTYESEGDTDVLFGGLLGAESNEITTSRAATATVDVPDEVGSGLRPYMICSDHVPGGTLPSAVVKVDFPGTPIGDGPCPTGSNPGNWWTINCPEGTNNSNASLAEKTRDGCTDPVSTVSPQPAPTAPPNESLREALLDGCDGGADQDCLNGVPGNIGGAEVWSAWSTLLGKSIVLPVFCGESVCDPAAVTDASGDNVNYPVHKFVGVTICGYHWGARSLKRGQTSTGVCSNNTSNYNAADGGEAANYLLLAYTQVQVSGTTGPSSCALGGACDGGLRRLLLTN
jgi:Flp pilus assembly protein TadG